MIGSRGIGRVHDSGVQPWAAATKIWKKKNKIIISFLSLHGIYRVETGVFWLALFISLYTNVRKLRVLFA